MTHKIKAVQPLDNFTLLVCFQNGIEKKYDIRKLYSVFPQFQVLEMDEELFQKVQVDIGGFGISWNDDLDLSAEDLWEDGIETGNKQKVDTKDLLAENLVKAREMVGFTQKQLSEITGIYQADISKIERGFANPSLSTLERLANGMGLKLKIEFVRGTNGDV